MKLVKNQTLKLECFKGDLYQRTLVKVFVKSDLTKEDYDVCVNDELLKSGLVFEYLENNLTKKTLK